MTVGPIEGITSVKAIAAAVATIAHKSAAVFGHHGYGRDLGLIIHLSASTTLGPDPNNTVLVAAVEEALEIGANAASIHVNSDTENESHMHSTLGEISRHCQE